MGGKLLTPARLQALGMVVIGVLAGFAAASAWNRLATDPTPPEPPPAEAREAEPGEASTPGHTPPE